ncbi:MAG: hypothetical protein AB1589_39515 [Cyanobacteriota bacterium]
MTNLFTKLSVATASAVLSLVAIKTDNAQAITLKFNIDPSASFISSYSASFNTIPKSFKDLGINTGDTIKLQRFGSFSPFGDFDNEYYGSMWAVFSTNNTLLPNSGVYDGATTDRVPGAVNAIVPNGCLPGQCLDNSIFYISRGDSFSSIVVKVPTNAQFLFIGGADSSFDDNVDLNNDFAVGISSVPTSTVPEPDLPFGLLVFSAYTIGWQFLRKRQKIRSI